MWQEWFGYSQCGRQEAACVHINVFRWRTRRLSTIETKRESRFFCNYCDSCNNSSYAFNFVSVLVFVLRVVFYVTRYMYDTRRQDFALSASFVSELEQWGDRKRQWLNCTEAKLCCRGSKRSWIFNLAVHEEFIYYRTYNSVGLNKGSQFSRCGRANSRLPMKKIKSLLQKTRKVRVFVWKGIRKKYTIVF